jgi:hypothetical protein
MCGAGLIRRGGKRCSPCQDIKRVEIRRVTEARKQARKAAKRGRNV